MGQCLELASIHQGMKQQVTTGLSNAARTSRAPLTALHAQPLRALHAEHGFDFRLALQ